MQPWNSSFPPSKGDGGSGLSQGCHSHLPQGQKGTTMSPLVPSCSPRAASLCATAATSASMCSHSSALRMLLPILGFAVELE